VKAEKRRLEAAELDGDAHTAADDDSAEAPHGPATGGDSARGRGRAAAAAATEPRKKKKKNKASGMFPGASGELHVAAAVDASPAEPKKKKKTKKTKRSSEG
jgi:hypothetical protein